MDFTPTSLNMTPHKFYLIVHIFFMLGYQHHFLKPPDFNGWGDTESYIGYWQLQK